MPLTTSAIASSCEQLHLRSSDVNRSAVVKYNPDPDARTNAHAQEHVVHRDVEPDTADIRIQRAEQQRAQHDRDRPGHRRD